MTTLDSWAGQSEQALIELAQELEVRTQELAAMQVRADSLQERVLKNASQRDVWRLERLASERAMLKANRKSDSLQAVVPQLQSAKKRRESSSIKSRSRPKVSRSPAAAQRVMAKTMRAVKIPPCR